MEEKIACPKCNYEPSEHDRWFCSKCNNAVWNTFDTQGVCPTCSYQWQDTQCPSCRKWSPHLDWYRLEAFLSEIKKLFNRIQEKKTQKNQEQSSNQINS